MENGGRGPSECTGQQEEGSGADARADCARGACELCAPRQENTRCTQNWREGERKRETRATVKILASRAGDLPGGTQGATARIGLPVGDGVISSERQEDVRDGSMEGGWSWWGGMTDK